MPSDIIFVTYVEDEADTVNVETMISSLRYFGGDLQHAPVWIFFLDENKRQQSTLDRDVQWMRANPKDLKGAYPFAGMVNACAQAEMQAGDSAGALVWVDPSCIFFQPPILLSLDLEKQAAVRPVHLKNIALEFDDDLDPYWEMIYRSIGVRSLRGTVTSFVDQKKLKPYFNSHCLTISPKLGLLQQWKRIFTSLVDDEDFQSRACSEPLRRVFLFQAVLSTLLVARLDWDQIRVLPPEYNYPLHLHTRIEPSKRVQVLNQLVSFTNEGQPIDPQVLHGIEVHDPQRSWLKDRYSRGYLPGS